ncbi:MAG: DNA gyrase subunit A, partial [Bacteroidia bacterium]|nr:DNA gyrase subunit A [Bacteroidia bacterium]
IVTEIPFLVNKADMIKKTADMVNAKKIEGISDIRDESDRTGMRIVYELKRDAISNIVLNNLFKYTPLQSSFSVNNVALVKGRPKSLNLLDLVSNFVEHRHEVLIRKTQYELEQAEKRQHILEGLLIALDNLDEVIALIRASKNPEEARTGLMEKFELSEIQAKAILEMRLQKLTGLERDKIKDEYKEISERIDYYRDVLATESLRFEILRDELEEVSNKYGDDRRTEIVHSTEDITVEDMIADEPVVITISHLGYIKRTPLADYRTQGRGGKGSKGSSTREEDFVEHLFVATNHNYILLFTENGKCYWLRVYNIPEGNKTAKGRAIQNLVQLPPDDNVKAFINVKDLKDQEYLENNFIVMCTKKGVIKKTSLEAYSRVRVSGINAISVREGDQLLEVKLTGGSDEILLANRSGRAIRFNESNVRPMGRTASGVRGITLQGEDDEVVGMVTVSENDKESILVVSENGYGKRSDLDDYRVTNRGGKGVKTINITEKTGALIAIKSVAENADLMIINKSGITIRMAVSDMRVMGRATQGVRLITLNEGDMIAAVAKIEDYDEDEDEVSKVTDELTKDISENGEARSDDGDDDQSDPAETDSDDDNT